MLKMAFLFFVVLTGRKQIQQNVISDPARIPGSTSSSTSSTAHLCVISFIVYI